MQAFAEIRRSDGTVARSIVLAYYIALFEIRSRYARSILGSFWITIQQALFVGAAALIFPAIFDTTLATYLPYFAVSLLLWNFMANCILEAMDALPANSPMIKDRGVAPEIFLFAVVFRNIMISAHAIPISLLAILIFQASSLSGFLLAIPGFVLFLVTVSALACSAGIVAAQYRDVKRASESVIQLAFLATPILWQPGLAGERGAFVVDYNPLAHLFNVWRQPLLDHGFSMPSFLVSVAVAALSMGVLWRLWRRMPQIALWI